MIFKRMSASLGVLLLAAALGAAPACAPSPPLPKPGGLSVGDKAYPFALSDSNGKILKLSDIQTGWCLVLIFYRGYWCGSCVSQLLNLKDDYPKFTQARATVAAVSADPIEDSARFAGEWRFPFPLLSDTRLEVIDAYGLRHPKGHENKDISHVAVLILDPQKVLRYKYVGKNPQDRPSDNEILFEIQKIQQEKH